MTFSDDHYYVTFGGNFLSGETWQTGFRCRPVESAPIANAAFLLTQLPSISVTDILTAVTAVITKTNVPFPNNVSARWAKVAVINEAGHYAGAPKLAEQAPVFGVNALAPPWLQLAWCVSLWSGESFGRANHGRMYWPSPAQLVQDPLTGKVTPTGHITAFRDNIRAMIDAINGEVSTVAVDTRPCIMSSLGSGLSKPIKFVGVGPVLDTIRSRREALDDRVTSWATGWS